MNRSALIGLTLLALAAGPARAQEEPASELAELRERVAELEERLAELEALLATHHPTSDEVAAGYFAPNGAPTAEQVPGVTWLRRVAGLTYKRPASLPRAVHSEWQSMESLTAGPLQEFGGEYVETEHGHGFQIHWLDPSSVLVETFGWRPGDVLLEANGLPITGEEAATPRSALVQGLQSERIALLVLRNGSRIVIPVVVR